MSEHAKDCQCVRRDAAKTLAVDNSGESHGRALRAIDIALAEAQGQVSELLLRRDELRRAFHP